ncbi:MAG: S8 family serine peptidase [Bacteroidales bacterium]
MDSPYNLNGSGYLIGEWDGGGIRLTHQEFDGRVSQMDAPAATSSHSTHVAGTMIAQGQTASAHGMANAANLNAYDWDNDITEMTSAAASGLTLSNQSYVMEQRLDNLRWTNLLLVW